MSAAEQYEALYLSTKVIADGAYFLGAWKTRKILCRHCRTGKARRKEKPPPVENERRFFVVILDLCSIFSCLFNVSENPDY